MTSCSPRPALTALLLLTLAGCSSAPATPPDPGAAETSGHGAMAGVAEVAEPPLHLVTIDAAGAVSMLDLLTGAASPWGSVTPPSRVTTDGRYVFAAHSDGVDILDSGVWTWDHGDHSHYYRTDPTTLGTVRGDGPATVATGPLATAGSTGLFFPASGTAVLLDNGALAAGSLVETLRLEVTPHAGLLAPLGAGAVVTAPGPDGTPDRLLALDAAGQELTTASCPDAAGTITTRVGVVIGCADGAVLATSEGDTPTLRHIPYPAGAAAPATVFAGRKGRPTVAGVGTDPGVWLLNSRTASWRWLPTTTPVLAAAAVDDDAEHVVVVGTDGTVQVYAGHTGERLSATAPLLPATLAAPELLRQVTLTVDGERAYLSAPAEGVVLELAYRDGARVARTLTLPTQPLHLVETGR